MGLAEQLNEAIAQTSLLQKRFLAIKEMTESGEAEPEKCAEILQQATGTAERLTVHARGIISSFANPAIYNEKIKKMAFDASEIEVETTPEGYLHITIPSLPPKKTHGTTAYLALPLDYALEVFKEQNPDFALNKKEKHAIWYMFLSDAASSKSRVDVDNWETEFITDRIALNYLIDDGPKYLPVAIHSVGLMGDGNETHIFTFPVSDLTVFWDTAIKRYSKGWAK